MSRTNRNKQKSSEGLRFTQPYRRIRRKTMLEKFEQEYRRNNQSSTIKL